MASETKNLADDVQRPPLELTFWRTLYRYLLSIVASLACGFIWTNTGAKLLHLQVLHNDLYRGDCARDRLPGDGLPLALDRPLPPDSGRPR